jgi:hypothetical protein
MEIKLDTTKTKRMVNMTNPTEKFKVVIDSEHQVEDMQYVVATREGKTGFVRVATKTLREVK